jgi:hypothetical protein
MAVPLRPSRAGNRLLPGGDTAWTPFAAPMDPSGGAMASIFLRVVMDSGKHKVRWNPRLANGISPQRAQKSSTGVLSLRMSDWLPGLWNVCKLRKSAPSE